MTYLYGFLVAMFAVAVACKTTAPEKQEEIDLAPLEQRIKNLEDQSSSNIFMIELDRCFIDLLMCDRAKKDKCWERHEQCAINVHQMYKARSRTN